MLELLAIVSLAAAGLSDEERRKVQAAAAMGHWSRLIQRVGLRGFADLVIRLPAGRLRNEAARELGLRLPHWISLGSVEEAHQAAKAYEREWRGSTIPFIGELMIVGEEPLYLENTELFILDALEVQENVPYPTLYSNWKIRRVLSYPEEDDFMHWTNGPTWEWSK